MRIGLAESFQVTNDSMKVVVGGARAIWEILMDSISAGQLYFELLQQESLQRGIRRHSRVCKQGNLKDAAKAQEHALASTGGLVGGAIAGKYLASKFLHGSRWQ